MLVLKFKSKDLEKRFNTIINDYGATWDYEDYTSHITLSYNAPNIDITKLPPYTGPINIVSEYAEDLDFDWTTDK